MKEIKFTPTGFESGSSYRAELLLNSGVITTITNLVQNTEYNFTVLNPGTYTLRVVRNQGETCVFSRVIQALFPIVTFNEGDVNCSTNTYSFAMVLQNPITAGNDVQYGWSLTNDCSTVTNWDTISEIILPADDVTRHVFVRNNDQQCCNFIASSNRSACVLCNLQVINIVFSCNG